MATQGHSDERPRKDPASVTRGSDVEQKITLSLPLEPDSLLLSNDSMRRLMSFFNKNQFATPSMAVGELLPEGGPLKLALIRVLIVEDSQPWQRAIRSILQESPELTVIGECSDGLEAIRISEQLQPDLVVLDIGLPSLNGLEATRRMRKVAPSTKILFLTAHFSAELIREALESGALGYVVKSNAASDLLPAVNAVMCDQRFVSSPQI
jgi:CheY-like chemotaxis protein